MGFNLTFHLSYKLRLLLLLTLCLTVVGWATSNYFVGAIQEIPKAKELVANFHKALILGKGKTLTNEASTKKAELDNCPSVSPYLRGQSKLIFKPDLTLEEVQAENPKVSRGRYHPEECKALQRVAILIPHRNREKHLMYLLEHLHPFLQRQQLDYGIYVIHQAEGKKFNRAKLLNVGYLEALKEENWDCFIFHDVDLVPENDFNLYKCEEHPKHLVVGRNSTGYRLRYSGYFGGVTALSREQFFKVNGFSNNYWGWGGEDDDLRLRVELHRMKISRPLPEVGKYTMVFHTRDKGNEVNAERYTQEQYFASFNPVKLTLSINRHTGISLHFWRLEQNLNTICGQEFSSIVLCTSSSVTAGGCNVWLCHFGILGLICEFRYRQSNLCIVRFPISFLPNDFSSR
ncbi:PREDICTED: beta-1,4-galactosyltransferase 4 isoform X1 [Cercocebus atys]|uniref:beta-1,4-galactosyltransferase 4 isoform X1 n=2 Tax=Cercocebus atys TaxID=9531 RepID=UPI0005F3D7DA|nr:PREDICTED: beta-1,4-galactosyltransferase 4 isoform X1 [Cercocebus atys]XP_011923797.1 PREDICTED: beta-1,4-galactosyltransferase 4 isoform X1 [Cercocebus atys]